MFTVTKLHPNSKIPTKGTEGSGGYDLYSLEDNVLSHGINKIRTGIAFAIPPGYVGIVHDRSSMALKDTHVHAGVIDSDYRGEIIVIMHSDVMYDSTFGYPSKFLTKNQRIAQIVVHKIYEGELVEVDTLTTTERSGGFGSTGV